MQAWTGKTKFSFGSMKFKESYHGMADADNSFNDNGGPWGPG